MEEKFKFLEEAKQHLKENFAYYEKEPPGRGEEFLEDVYQKIYQITKRPLSYSIIYDDVRKASISKFPFNIYYAQQDTIVIILAIWHKKRKQNWMGE